MPLSQITFKSKRIGRFGAHIAFVFSDPHYRLAPDNVKLHYRTRRSAVPYVCAITEWINYTLPASHNGLSSIRVGIDHLDPH